MQTSIDQFSGMGKYRFAQGCTALPCSETYRKTMMFGDKVSPF